MEKKTILLVDDDEGIRSLCQEVLSEDGYTVIEAKDGRDAVRKVEQNDPDLVILDIHMPRLNSVEALPKMLRKKRNLPVILYTGYTPYSKDFQTWAADAYVVKSSDLGELREKVKRLFSGIESGSSIDLKGSDGPGHIP